ncbi:MAG: 4Fe-4S dicluster domain-containing protein [Desulfohalobiaceae bacterium]
MSKYYLFQDQKKCIGCHACELACSLIKDLKPGPKPTQIIETGLKWVGHMPRTSFVFMPCFHCENPWCVAACPTGAMQKRPEDGIVFVDSQLCVGCKTCMSACPWGAPQWNPDTGKVVKCDLCKDRIDAGLRPACAAVCSTHCIHFGQPEEMPQIRRERYARAKAQER